MKLKYYIRGVGCGILFTMFIFMVIIIPSLKLDNKIETNTNTEKNENENSQAGKLVGPDATTKEAEKPTEEIVPSAEPTPPVSIYSYR